MSRSPLEAGQTPQILPVGDAQTNIGCMILESLENRFHGAFLKHAVNLVEIQLDRDSSWVGEGLMEFGQKALSPQELEKTTLILLRREYEKIAIARANNVLVQVGTKDLGVVVKPLPKKKFLSLFQWAKKNNLITTETVVNLLPFWADLVPFHNPGKLEDLLKIYWNDASGEKKLKPSVPAKLLAGAVASRGLAEIIEKKRTICSYC